MARGLKGSEEVEMQKVIKLMEDVNGVTIDKVKFVAMLEKRNVVRFDKRLEDGVLKETVMMCGPNA
jgi:Asp-tRNA(Asn)/Glu-tRNA(Gln) amidotransferase C subunit